MIDGSPVAAATIDARLRETAGAVVLQELALDAIIAKEFSGAGLSVSADAVRAERRLLLATITADAGVEESQAAVLVDRFRRARGLGPVRYEALLQRNARLRALVEAGGLVTSADIESGIAAELGATVLARIVVTSSYEEAARTLDAVRSEGEGSARSMKFAEAAMRISRDPSAPRGGLFGPTNPEDPQLPRLIRTALSAPPGSVSDVLALDAGFAVVLVESRTPARAMPSGSELDRLRERVKMRKQREAMDRLAARLETQVTVSPIDDGLTWSWESRPRP